MLWNWLSVLRKTRVAVVTLSRSDHYKLMMLAEDLTNHPDTKYEIDVDYLATRVVKTFIQEAYGDSTDKLVKRVIPDIRRNQNRRY